MLRYLIPAILSVVTSGCIVATYGHVQSVEQLRNDKDAMAVATLCGVTRTGALPLALR